MSVPKNYLSTKEVSDLLGHSVATIRKWGRQRAFKTFRRPTNGHLFYRRKDVLKILKYIENVNRRTTWMTTNIGL